VHIPTNSLPEFTKNDLRTTVLSLKWSSCWASFTLSRFSVPASLRCGHCDHTVATTASLSLDRDTPCWTGVHRKVSPVVSIFETSGTHRDAPHCETTPAYSITVALPAWTVSSPYDHRDTPWRLRGYTGNVPSQTVASPGQTVITFCPKPVLVRSAAGNVWAHSNSFTLRPGSSRSTGYNLPGRTRAYTWTVWTRL